MSVSVSSLLVLLLNRYIGCCSDRIVIGVLVSVGEGVVNGSISECIVDVGVGLL